jgi:hypothetical protein
MKVDREVGWEDAVEQVRLHLDFDRPVARRALVAEAAPGGSVETVGEPGAFLDVAERKREDSDGGEGPRQVPAVVWQRLKREVGPEWRQGDDLPQDRSPKRPNVHAVGLPGQTAPENRQSLSVMAASL